jgi:DNA-binding transcriptional MerR regulator
MAAGALNLSSPLSHRNRSVASMINPMTRAITTEGMESPSREIQLFEPPPDAAYTIEETSRLVNVSRRTILVYCKHRLLSPVAADHGYYFDRDAIRGLRRIEALRTMCGHDFVGIKIILNLTAALERLRSDIRLLSRAKGSDLLRKNARDASTVSSRRKNVKSNSRRKLE